MGSAFVVGSLSEEVLVFAVGSISDGVADFGFVAGCLFVRSV